jgi:hypothetical protein
VKKFSIIVVAFLILLQFKLFALLPEFEHLYPIGAIVTQDDFLERFKNKGFIGAGGESKVYKVCDQETNKEYALAVNRSLDARWLESDENMYFSYKNFAKRMIELQQYNPHQAVIHGYFWMKIKSLYDDYGINLGFDVKKYIIKQFKQIPLEGQFLAELTEDDVNSEEFKSIPEDRRKGTLFTCMLLELGEADLESRKYACSDLKINAELEDIMFRISAHFIRHAGVNASDNKLRNYVYVRSENVFYGDRPMSDYAYWHYMLKGDHYYIPALPIVIKRIDYPSWSLHYSDVSSCNCFNNDYFKLDNYAKYRRKPNVPDDQILDILDYALE